MKKKKKKKKRAALLLFPLAVFLFASSRRL